MTAGRDKIRHPVIGVTGLPCSGKSFAAGLLAKGLITGEEGEMIKADNLGHLVLARSEVRDIIRNRLGPEIYAPAPDGQKASDTIVRRRIGHKVFGDPEQLAWLESLVHPLVRRETEEMLSWLRGERTVVVEAALLFSANMHELCDIVLLVEASRETRLRRAMERGWDDKELTLREERLLPLFREEALSDKGGNLIRIPNEEDDNALMGRIGAALKPIVAMNDNEKG